MPYCPESGQAHATSSSRSSVDVPFVTRLALRVMRRDSGAGTISSDAQETEKDDLINAQLACMFIKPAKSCKARSAPLKMGNVAVSPSLGEQGAQMWRGACMRIRLTGRASGDLSMDGICQPMGTRIRWTSMLERQAIENFRLVCPCIHTRLLNWRMACSYMSLWSADCDSSIT